MLQFTYKKTIRDRIRSNTTQCRARGSRRRQRRRLKQEPPAAPPAPRPHGPVPARTVPLEAPTQKRPQGDDPMKTNRIIRRCTRKTCGHVWAREYEGTPKSGNLCRTDESGRRISASDSNEWTCPKCGRWEWVKGGTVNGTVSDHKCGAKCLSAIGPNCECSCGGANHGKNWL